MNEIVFILGFIIFLAGICISFAEPLQNLIKKLKDKLISKFANTSPEPQKNPTQMEKVPVKNP